MQQRLWLAFAIVAGVALAAQVLWPEEIGDLPETTFDTAPRGHAGVFALLDRFEAARGRWLTGLSMPAREDTIWWIAPDGTCQSKAALADAQEAAPPAELAGPTADAKDTAETQDAPRLSVPFRYTVQPWIESGGTAVVWLSHPPSDLPIEVEAEAEAEAEIDADANADAEDEDAGADAEEGGEERVAEVREEWADDLESFRTELLNGEPGRCATIAGFELPPRRMAGLEGGELPPEGRYSPVVFSVGRATATATREAFDYAAARTLPGPTLAFFELSAGGAEVEVEVERDGEGEAEADVDGEVDRDGWRPLWVDANTFAPFAIERRLGEGRLVVVADARVLTNGRLGLADSAPFVFDWVRDLGVPWIDEHAHGVVEERGTFRYLVRSPAWAAGLGLLVLGGLVVWRGNAWPARDVVEAQPNAPTLSAFVDSLALLYSDTRDHQRVFERYRAICLDRIRRALGLSPGTSSEIILGSLRARGESWPALREAGLSHLLTRQIPVGGAEDLERNVARLDELVRVIRESGAHSAQAASQARRAKTKGTR